MEEWRNDLAFSTLWEHFIDDITMRLHGSNLECSWTSSNVLRKVFKNL